MEWVIMHCLRCAMNIEDSHSFLIPLRMRSSGCPLEYRSGALRAYRSIVNVLEASVSILHLTSRKSGS